MKSYSMDLRCRVLAACDAGHSTSEVARRFDVSPAWVRRLKQRRRETGDIAPRKRGRTDFGMFDRRGRAALRRMIQRSPDATLVQLQRQVAEELEIECCLFTIWWALRRMGVSLKKSPSSPSNSVART